MAGPARIGRGALTDPSRSVRFRFDGRELQGRAGDSLASALLANGVLQVGRSFKYHRPRGIVTAGPEEPCALVDVIGVHGREPNVPATTLALSEGLCAESQNRWPSLRFDVRSLADRLGRFLPAGFYYKTFMAPGWAWERLYEPLIRRAAGLGRLSAAVQPHADPAETVHDHADVLVVGAGAAGLAAAHRLGTSGLRVILAEQDMVCGGGTLLDDRWTGWRESLCAALARLPSVRCLTRTTVLGAYGHGVFGALETLAPDESARFGGLRERLRVMRVRRVLLATGALERLIAFPGNDVPGVMLAGAALRYLRRYGVAAGRRPALFVNNDEAYAALFALAAAGIHCAGVIDPRAHSAAAARAKALGVAVHDSAVVGAVHGRHEVRAITINELDGRRRFVLEADALLVSGGQSPAIALAAQLGASLGWHASPGAFIPELAGASGRLAGSARGMSGLEVAAVDGDAAGAALVADLGSDGGAAIDLPPVPRDPESTPMELLWEVRGRGKAFVDLQNDVTTDDVRLAVREGYEHLDHMKRYTTFGMATDQGRIGGLVGCAVLAEARGVPLGEVGALRSRPFAQPVPFAALAGSEVRAHFRPRRRLALHAWHQSAGATFVSTGLWLRPLAYSREPGWAPVLEEARAVRERVGITDVSTLGKIDVQGPDAARFLDFIYANTFSTLAVGRARYGIMLREDGLLLDDGTTSRLAPEHFIVTTTTANSVTVLEHLEFHLQSTRAGLDVVLTDITDQWAQFALAGPRARDVLAPLLALELSNEAFPFMAAAETEIAGVAGRLFRISFSGELAYEIAVPASAALGVWSALLQAGARFDIRPYGLDALNTLRIEKGHVTTAELNGNTTAEDLGLQRLLKKQGDFIGRTLAQRAALKGGERLQLVGVRPTARTTRLRNGSQLVATQAPDVSLGYLTSATPSLEFEGWVGLALLSAGRQRLGQRLLARSPVHGEEAEVQVLSAHMLDPENTRVRS